MHTMSLPFLTTACGPRLRRPQLLVQCSKGFGNGDGSKSGKKGAAKGPHQASVQGGDAKAVDRAVKLVEDRKARPVDSREAAEGRVEFVKVKDWGSGEPQDLGELQVEAASAVQLGADAPLFEQLAKRLELLEAQKAMAVAQPKDAKPLPPFKRWAFAEAHYLQYLCDLLSVHRALEQVLVQGIASSPSAATLVPGSLKRAVLLIGPESGLFRSVQLATDIQRLADEAPLPPPSPNAAGLAQFLGTLTTRLSTAESEQEAKAVVLKLLAHAYVLMLVLLSSGGRIAAAAAEKLSLFPRGALNTYRTYPSHVSDPLEQLKGIINQWGELLSESDKEELMEELPSAMQKASLLLTPLAQE